MRQWNGYQKGINLGGWFSQCEYTKEHFDHFIRKEDIKELSTWGIDHLRIPVDYNLVEQENGEYLEEGFAYIQRILDWCGEYGLHMILDLHKTAGYSFDAGEKEDGFFRQAGYQERFYSLWEEFATRYGRYRNRLAFELLNEVTDQVYGEKWNEISGECIRRIRRIEPEIDILVGGYWNNNIRAVKDLAEPQDRHIIYNFHCYDPLVFTHQGAWWTAGMPEDFRFAYRQSYQAYYDALTELFGDAYGEMPRMEQMEEPFGTEFFTVIFAEAIQTAAKRDVPLYCGEYGVIDRAEPDDALEWYRAIHAAFERYGIGRAAWTYRGLNYGLSDEHFQGVLEEIKKCL